MGGRIGSVLWVVVVVLVALLCTLAGYAALTNYLDRGETEEALHNWADLVREELTHPAPDPALLTRTLEDPRTGGAAVGLLIVDGADRTLFTNRPDFFAPGSVARLSAEAADDLAQLEMGDAYFLIRWEELPPSAAVGRAFAVFLPAPTVDLTPESPLLPVGLAATLGLVVLLVGLRLRPPGRDRFAHRSGSSKSVDSTEGKAGGLDPRLLGDISREIVTLARGLRDLGDEMESVPPATDRWPAVEERMALLLGAAADMAVLAEMADDDLPPTEAFSLAEALEDVVHRSWDELSRHDARVTLNTADLRVEGDVRIFSRGLAGMIRALTTDGGELRVTTRLTRGWISIVATPMQRGGGTGEPGRNLRSSLGMEIARAAARKHGGDLSREGTRKGGLIMRVPQWQGDTGS